MIPGFHSVMALLGSFFSFTVSVVFPEACYLMLFHGSLSKRAIVIELLIAIFGIICGLLGTIWVFFSL
jgi:vesicular inhibitory amino acid transporter